MKKRFLSMFALLAAVVSGAWAQTTINVTAGDLGKAVCTDGSIYDNVDAAQSAGKTAVAKIICLDTQNSKALALSLNDQAVTPSTVNYATAQSRCEELNTTLAVTFGTWVLPSKAQWEAIIEAAGGYQALRDEFAFLFGGTKMEAVPYWSSTAGTTGHWLINFYDGKWEDGTYNSSARACLVINLPQTYSVTLKDDTEDAGNWTISPAKAVEGAEVTATYSGDRKVKSVKAVKVANPGLLSGVFSVSSTKKVNFSKGNLQLVGENTFQFAENQWDYFGSNQSDNHRDLFSWGTGNNPNQTTGNSTFTDWGDNTYLQATLGKGWRTMTKDEFVYVFNTRASGSSVFGNANGRYTTATINTDGTGVNGFILFPDGITIAASEVTTAGTINNKGTVTQCTKAQWAALAEKGCVFLPAAGYFGSGYGNITDYWSSTAANASTAYNLNFNFGYPQGGVKPASNLGYNYGCSVRLVQEVAAQ